MSWTARLKRVTGAQESRVLEVIPSGRDIVRREKPPLARAPRGDLACHLGGIEHVVLARDEVNGTEEFHPVGIFIARNGLRDPGVAAVPAVEAFPQRYEKTGHLHIATMPPHEQLAWLELARTLDHCTTSVDMFEPTAAESPKECRELCHSADLIFMNEQECRLLFTDHPLPADDIVLKKGPGGAAIRSHGAWTHVPASRHKALDSTGAGELLAGAFLSIRAMGLPEDVALRYAVRAASAKVVEFGVNGENLHRALTKIHSEVTGSTTRPTS